jgi:hypothetical protein
MASSASRETRCPFANLAISSGLIPIALHASGIAPSSFDISSNSRLTSGLALASSPFLMNSPSEPISASPDLSLLASDDAEVNDSGVTSTEPYTVRIHRQAENRQTPIDNQRDVRTTSPRLTCGTYARAQIA